MEHNTLLLIPGYEQNPDPFWAIDGQILCLKEVGTEDEKNPYALAIDTRE